MNRKYLKAQRSEQRYIQKLFSNWAWAYDFEKYILFILRKIVVHFAEPKCQQKIIDVATGTGSQASEFAKAGHAVVGIDFSWGMLEQARKKQSQTPNLILIQADATRLPFQSAAFDISTISLALHDMPYETEMEVLKEMKRVTKKSGKSIIVEYQEPRNHWAAKIFFPLACLYETMYFKPFIKRGLKSIVRESQLKIIKQTNFLNLVQILEVKNETKKN